MTERVEPLTQDQLAVWRDEYATREPPWSRPRIDIPDHVRSRLLDIAEDHARLVAERDALRAEVERLQGYIDERDVEIVRLHHARADALNAANARIEKLERVRKAAQSLSLAVDDPHACAVIDSDNRLLKAALAALAACDEEGGK